MIYGQLPKPIPDRVLGGQIRILAQQPILYCDGCGGEYSANPGDYWQVPRHEEITCGECGDLLRLVMKRTIYEDVELPEGD